MTMPVLGESSEQFTKQIWNSKQGAGPASTTAFFSVVDCVFSIAYCWAFGVK